MSASAAYTDERHKKRRHQLEELSRAELERGRRALEDEKQQALSALDREDEELKRDGQRRKNAYSAQYMRERRSFDERAAASGLGSGSRAQRDLEQRSAYLRGLGRLDEQAGLRRQENLRRGEELRRKYGRLISDAEGKSASALERSLMAEDERALRELTSDARILAAFGDFSGYEKLYGKEKAGEMRRGWIMKSPLAAYRTGAIDAGTYIRLTGRRPPG